MTDQLASPGARGTRRRLGIAVSIKHASSQNKFSVSELCEAPDQCGDNLSLRSDNTGSRAPLVGNRGARVRKRCRYIIRGAVHSWQLEAGRFFSVANEK